MLGDYRFEHEIICMRLNSHQKVPLVAKVDYVFDFKRLLDSKSILESHDYRYFANEHCVIDGRIDGKFHLTFKRKGANGEPLQALLCWREIFENFERASCSKFLVYEVG